SWASRMSAPDRRPTSRMPKPWRRSKKLRRSRGASPRATRARHSGRGLVPGRDAGRPEEQTHLSLGQKGLTSSRQPRSTHPIDLSVRCGVPATRSRRRPGAAGLQHRGHAASSRRDRHQGHPWRPRHSHPRSSRMAWRERPQGPEQHLAPATAATCSRAQQPGKHLAVHAAELALEPHLQVLRRHRRSPLLRLEHPDRSTLENHVYCPPRLGGRRSLIVRVGISPRRASCGRATWSLSSLGPVSCMKSTSVTVARWPSQALFSFAKLISALPGAPSTDGTALRATPSSDAWTRTTARSLTSKTYSFMSGPSDMVLTPAAV